MDRASAVVLGLLCFSLFGCATPPPRSLAVVEGEGVGVFYSAGNSCGGSRESISETETIQVAVCAVPVDRKRGRIDVFLFNETSRPVTLIDSNVTASIGNTPVRVLRYADLMAEEKSRQRWASVGAALAAGADGYAAGQSGYSTTSGNVSGNYSGYGSKSGSYGGQYSGTYTARTYDAEAARRAQQDAQARNQQRIRDLNAQAAAGEASIEALALRSQTVAPGESTRGAVFLELPKQAMAGNVSVRVVAEGVEFVFPLTIGE